MLWWQGRYKNKI